MSDTPATLQIWGAVLIKNNLLSQEKWDECLAVHKRAGGGTPIATSLAQKNYLTARGIDVVGKKEGELAAKQKAAAAAPAKPVGAAPVIAPPRQVVAPARAPAAAPAKPAASAAPGAPAAQEPDTIELGEATGDPAGAHWRGTDT